MYNCVTGLLVNGPYALITTSVSAELGTHRSLVSSAKALATVTAIIDGTGSIGKYQEITHLTLIGSSDTHLYTCNEEYLI